MGMRYIFTLFFILFLSTNAYSFATRTGSLPDNSFWHNDKSYFYLGFKYCDKDFDPFDFIEDELDSINKGTGLVPGEMKGVNFSFYKKIFPYLSGEIKIQSDDYDFGWNSLRVDNYSGKINFIKKIGNFGFAASFGGEYMKSQDMKMDNPDSINYMIKRISPETSIKLAKHSDGYWIDLGDGTFVRSGTSSSEIVPSVTVYDSDSISYFAGISMHYKLNKIYSGLFFECGQNIINSKIDTAIDDYIGDLKDYLTEEQKKILKDFPIDLERDETFFTAGTYLQFPLFLKLEGNFSFTYIWLDGNLKLITSRKIIL